MTKQIKPSLSEDEVEAGVPCVCEGCGHSWKLSALKRTSPQVISCCPDRRMVRKEEADG